MNTTLRTTLALSVSLLAAASAFADGDTYTANLPQSFTSTQSRADVKAEVLRARAGGTLVATEHDFQKEAPFVSYRTRAAVHAEAVAQQSLGDTFAAEPHGFTVEASAAPLRTALR